MNAQIAARSGDPSVLLRASGGATGEIASEIERLQRSHSFSRYLPHAAFVSLLAASLIAESLEDLLCALVIGCAAAPAIGLWARNRVLGMPLMPSVSLLYFLFYGMPFLTAHPFTQQYQFDDKLFAASSIAGVLLVATGVWYSLGRSRPRTWQRIWRIKNREANALFLVGLALGCAFQANALFGIVHLSSEVNGIARAILLSFGVISVFALGYQAGGRKLTRGQHVIYLIGLIAYIALSTMSLYLITAIQLGLLGGLGYFLGGGKPPLKAIGIGLALLIILSAGKSEVRDQYWGEEGYANLSFGESITMLGEWFTFGIEHLTSGRESDSRVTLAERASLTQMVLKAETDSPEPVPYLMGSSYTIIPQLMVPRIIWPERPSTQEALRKLSETYGVLTTEGLETTSVGWGLVAEAYANFGVFGCLALGVVLGVGLGYTQRICGRAPVVSTRGLFAFLVLQAMISVETNAALLVTAFIQSLLPLALATWAVMETTDVAL